MIKFIIGASGSGKSTELISEIDKQANKNREVCILVPEQFSAEFDKKLYSKIGAVKFNKLFSLSFTGLSRQLFQLYGDKRKSGVYADELVRMILVYQAILSVQKNPELISFFRKQCGYQGFAEEMLKLINEMKRSGIVPQFLKEKSVLLEKKLMDKTNDIALIYLEYEKIMAESGYKDSSDDIKAAAEIANVNQYFCGKDVFIDEFESFTGDQLEFIKTIIFSAENVYIALRTEDVNAGEYTLFETVNRTYRAITDICRELHKSYEIVKCDGNYRFHNEDISYMSSNILRNSDIKLKSVPAPNNIVVFEARDYYSEVEYVCATIKRLLYNDKNLRYRDIAIISNNISDYAEVLEASFERYDIPYFMSIEKPVNHTSIMIFFQSLLEIITRKAYSSEILFRFMKCDLININLVDISLIENYCYKWSIEGELWKELFTAYDENLERLEGIRKSIIEPLEKLKQKTKKEKSSKKICRLLYEYLVECGAEKNVAVIMSKLIKENKDYEALEIKRLWSCLIDILDSTSEALGESEVSVSDVKKIIKSLIGRINYSVPPQTLDSVTAASARTARLSSPKIVIIMGANDGSFPSTVNTSGILSENEKQKLFETGIELSRPISDLIAAERLVVYKALSAASEKVYITYSLSDPTGQSKYPATIIDEITTLFNSKSLIITEAQIKPDYYAVTMKSAFYHYMQDKKENSSSIASIKKLLMSDSEYKRKLIYILSRSGERKKYTLNKNTIEELKSFSPFYVSSSSFEKYNKCHFQYFCDQLLNLHKCQKIDMDVSSTGSIIHSCFYNIISSRQKDEFVRMSFDEIAKEINACTYKFRDEKMGGEFAKTPRFELIFQKLSERLGKIFVHAQQELMASSFEPKVFEVDLRKEKNFSPLELEFGTNKKLSFGGIIDRADVCTINDKKYLRIVDYKSSAKKIDSVNLANGINMQMLLYLFSITENGNTFSDYMPAGVLYSPIDINKIEIDKKRSEIENTSCIDSSLKSAGLVLSDINVLEAMEHNISGKYIPVKLDKTNNIDKNSSCITDDGFTKLKEYAYKKLTDMAESVYDGDADANPLLNDKKMPCQYCEYTNICGHTGNSKYRDAAKTDTTEIDEILLNKKISENGGEEK